MAIAGKCRPFQWLLLLDYPGCPFSIQQKGHQVSPRYFTHHRCDLIRSMGGTSPQTGMDWGPVIIRPIGFNIE
jgi:hypothetical protein